VTNSPGKLVRPTPRPPSKGSRPPGRPRKPPHRQTPGLGLVLAIALIVMVVVVVVVIAVTRLSVPAIPTVALLPTATVVKPADSPTPEVTLTPTDMLLARATLPPTWTPPPTIVANPTATITPTLLPGQSAQIGGDGQPVAVYATLSPAQLANTYWEGDGTESMWDYQFPDGTFGRFTYLPVNFWVGARGVSITQEHEAAIQNAIDEIGQVVPIQRVDNRIFAHMTLWLMSDAEFEQNVTCEGPEMTIGCASFTYTDVGILLVSIWLRASTENFATTLLHELTHGLGIPLHSPYEADVMYAYDMGQAPHYTQHDLNTLRALYSAPPYDPRHN